MNNNSENNSSFIIFKTEDEKVSVDVRFEEETVWLTQEQMAVLFGKARTTVTEHINNIFKEGELVEEVACRKFRHTTQHGAIEGKTQEVLVDVQFEDETVRLTQEKMAVLFGKAKSTIKERVKNIYAEKELEESGTIKKFGISEFQ
jgi:hypothetical protein